MIRGIYTSGWSMLANSKKMDVISNNLANVNTNAYKKDTVVFESFPDVLAQRMKDTYGNGEVGKMQLGSDVGEIFTNYIQGQVVNTDRRLDMALKDNSKGFFSVETIQPNGDIKEFYTRDGAFSLDSKGKLVNKDGYAVVGENGPIILNGDSFSVTRDGAIVQNNIEVGRLKLVSITNSETLRKEGNNLLQGTAETKTEAFTGTVEQGYLEQSNVNVVKEMVDMISVTRSYEASQKVLQAQDGTLEKAVNELGSIR